MSDAYTGRRSTYRETKDNKKMPRLGKLLIKQTAAAIVCTLVVWGMNSVPVTRLNEYAHALGRAIRYESNLDMFKQLYEDVIEKFADKETEH